nr:MAG TPA: hypothetical protein [Caudoviricetes sp.]
MSSNIPVILLKLINWGQACSVKEWVQLRLG